MNPATGPKSVSFKFSAAGILTGLGTLITGLVQNPDALKNGTAAVTDVRTAIGATVVAISVAAKLIHDNGFNKASIAAAGNEIAGEIPNIKNEFAKAASLVENDFPSLQNDFAKFKTDITAHIGSVESRVTSLTGLTPQMVEDAVRHILANAQPVTPPAPTPAASSSAPSQI